VVPSKRNFFDDSRFGGCERVGLGQGAAGNHLGLAWLKSLLLVE
jgi:hypothetical protein